MQVTPFTWIIGVAGIALMGVLMIVQFIAVVQPRALPDGWRVAFQRQIEKLTAS